MFRGVVAFWRYLQRKGFLASSCAGIPYKELSNFTLSRQQASLASVSASLSSTLTGVEQSLLLVRDVDIMDAPAVERINSNDTEWYWVDEFESLPPFPDCPDREIDDYGKHRTNVNRKRQLSLKFVPELANKIRPQRSLDFRVRRNSENQICVEGTSTRIRSQSMRT